MNKENENLNEEKNSALNIADVSKSLPSDTEMLNWIESIMTPKESYCEVFFAGLRDGNSDASMFQIECNPERFEVMQAKSLREVIVLAMQKYPKIKDCVYYGGHCDCSLSEMGSYCNK